MKIQLSIVLTLLKYCISISMERKVSHFFPQMETFLSIGGFSHGSFWGHIDNRLEMASHLSAISEGIGLRISVLSSLCLPLYEPNMAHIWRFKPFLPWLVQSICLDYQSHVREMQHFSIVENVRREGVERKETFLFSFKSGLSSAALVTLIYTFIF